MGTKIRSLAPMAVIDCVAGLHKGAQPFKAEYRTPWLLTAQRVLLYTSHSLTLTSPTTSITDQAQIAAHYLNRLHCYCALRGLKNHGRITNMTRDDFPQKIKDALAKRVSYRCANPRCRSATTGPHADPSKFVNIGVAAHITAASPGGPRYDQSLSPAERSSADNGIWLCQSCSSLVDKDIENYSEPVLMRWKFEAEARALREISGEFTEDDYFPQPVGAIHAPIPKIGGLTYDEARQLLFEAGWQPRMQHWSKGGDWDMTFGTALYFWNKGFHEICTCAGTGANFCTFAFFDVYGNALLVVTAGEVFEDSGENIVPHVWSWRFEK